MAALAPLHPGVEAALPASGWPSLCPCTLTPPAQPPAPSSPPLLSLWSFSILHADSALHASAAKASSWCPQLEFGTYSPGPLHSALLSHRDWSDLPALGHLRTQTHHPAAPPSPPPPPALAHIATCLCAGFCPWRLQPGVLITTAVRSPHILTDVPGLLSESFHSGPHLPPG